jgi:hypothetical protein
VALIACDRRLIAFRQSLFVRGPVTADAQIMKRALGPFFIALVIPDVSRIALAAVTRSTLHKDRNAAGFSPPVMTPEALGSFLSLMSKISVGMKVLFVVAVAKRNDTAGSVEIQLKHACTRVFGFYPIAIGLIRRRARKHRRGHGNCEECYDEQLESHQNRPSNGSINPYLRLVVWRCDPLAFFLALARTLLFHEPRLKPVASDP